MTHMEELDKIHIVDLLLRCIIGINDEEREKKQDVLINMTLYADLTRPGQTDDINDTVDYKKVKQEVIRLVENSSFFLIEKLAQEIADICLKDRFVQMARVSVDKPSALRFAKSVNVEITRKKQ